MLRSILRDSVVYGVASLLSKGLTIFLLPLYTRVLSASDYGAYDLLVTWGALMNLVGALEVSQGLARYWADAVDATEKRHLASTSLWFSVAAYGMLLTLGLLAAPQLNQWILGDVAYLDAFRLGLGFIAVNGIYYLVLNQFRWELRSKAYAAVNFCYAFMTLIFAACFCLLLNMHLEGIMLSQLLATICAVLLSVWLLRQSFGLTFNFPVLISMLKFSAPLVPAGLAVFLSLYINRFALNYFGSLEDVGLFGIGSRIAGLSALLIVGIQGALTPLIYQHYQAPETPSQIARLFGWFLAVALTSCLFLTLFAKELLLVFATNEYQGGAALVVYLAPALLLSQMYIFAPGIAIMKKTHWQLLVTLLSAATSAVANLVLVPLWGVLGAALATLLASLVFFFAWLMVSQRLYQIPYAWRACALGVGAYALAAPFGYWIEQVGLDLLTGIGVKLVVMFAMLLALVAARLLPLADIAALLRRGR